jgi:DNA replication protein DnaC
MGPRERVDLLELLDDRVGTRSAVITSQLPIENWHDYIGDPTLADAIMDRLIHSAHKIRLGGETLRNNHAKEQKTGGSKAKKFD